MAAHAAALFERGSRVYTHCNTGGLATGGCPSQQVSREWFLAGSVPNDCPEHAGGIAGFLERTFGKWFR